MDKWTPDAVYRLLSSLATLGVAVWLIFSHQEPEYIAAMLIVLNQVVASVTKTPKIEE